MKYNWTLCLILSSFSVCLSDKITDADAIEELFKDYFNWKLKNSPQKATALGFNEFSDQVETQNNQPINL